MRDLRHEHIKRKEHKKRLLADIDKDRALAFLEYLRRADKTYTNWLIEHINSELDKT